MRRKIFAWTLFSALFLVASGASLAVMPDQTQVVNTKSNNQQPFIIPNTAVQVAPNVFSLGSAVDPDTGKMVDGFMIVHPKQEKAQGNAKKPGGTSACYSFLASGAKWKTVEPWMVNATNSAAMSSTDVFSLLQQGVGKWEDATDGSINDFAAADVLGDGSLTPDVLVSDSSAPDNKNEVYFGSIANSNTIAVTTVWGIFRGPTASRELVEWDMVFDDVKFSWSTTGALSSMDFGNIATHELGHAVGLADLYNTCVDETMYGYATEGETKKRDLNTGDLQGMNSLY